MVFAPLVLLCLNMEPPVGSSSCDMELSLAWSKMDLIIPKLKLTGCDNLVINSNKCDKHNITPLDFSEFFVDWGASFDCCSTISISLIDASIILTRICSARPPGTTKSAWDAGYCFFFCLVALRIFYRTDFEHFWT